MTPMLLETGRQQDKMDSSNKGTFLFVQSLPTYGKSQKTIDKEKYISCTQNVQPTLTEQILSSQPRSFMPTELKALNCQQLKHATPAYLISALLDFVENVLRQHFLLTKTRTMTQQHTSCLRDRLQILYL